jgi:hypothetical protein
MGMGCRANAWCLLIHAEASLSQGQHGVNLQRGTLKLPAVSTQPVPARKPPVTGDGSRRTMFPRRAPPTPRVAPRVGRPRHLNLTACSCVPVYPCIRAHSPHPPPWPGHSFPVSHQIECHFVPEALIIPRQRLR